MGPIRQLFSNTPDLKKTDTQKKINDTSAKKTGTTENSSKPASGKDQVQISDKGRELLTLKAETENYLNNIREAELISPQEIEAIKEKIEAKYYFDEEVINDLVDKLAGLPDYKDFK